MAIGCGFDNTTTEITEQQSKRRCVDKKKMMAKKVPDIEKTTMQFPMKKIHRIFQQYRVQQVHQPSYDSFNAFIKKKICLQI
jgi:hypothetical protein